jgi:hypothetical protein
LAVALFNTVNYLPTRKKLSGFFTAVSRLLSKNALFIFDCWNGSAALKDPPRKKQTTIPFKNKKIRFIMTPQTNFKKAKTLLNYRIQVFQNRRLIRQQTHQVPHHLWIPKEIKSACQLAGLKIISCSPVNNPRKKATYKDYKILFITQKL